MFFVHCVVQGERVAKTAPPPETLVPLAAEPGNGG